MLNSFIFKEFTILQDRCAMKVGTDGVLLGAWAHGGKHILDIGSGTGLIAMMMAQRFRDAVVEGVEVDANAVIQSRENSAHSPFAERVSFHHSPLQSWIPETTFDVMVTNPPFFLNSLQAPDRARARARNAEFLPFTSIFSFARRWLDNTGELSAVVPADTYEAFASEAFLQGFFLSRLCRIKPTCQKPVKRCLVAFSKQRSDVYDEQTVELTMPDGNRTRWYQELTNDFYLK